MVAFFYMIFIKPNGNRFKYIISAVSSFATVSVMFIYMMFFAQARKSITLDYVMERTSEFVSKSVSSIENHRSTIQGYLFRDGGESGLQFALSSYWLILVVMLIMFSPFIYEVYRYWKYVVTEAKLMGKSRLLYSLIPLGIITTIPMYIMHCDYGRWTYQVFFYEFTCIWFLNLVNNECIISATHKMYKHIQENRAYYIVLLFYASVSGAFDQNLINPMISTIETNCWKILSLLGL
jgi:hypothetical protein